MAGLLNRLFRVEPGEWPKLLQFGLFGLLLQTGMGIGFAAGDAAFLTHVGADKLPVIFLLTPAVMIVYTGYFSYLLMRFGIDRVVEASLGLLIAGGAILWALIEVGLPQLYTLFWNFTDTYFDIQDAKRLFPLFAAFCALGTTLGALIVSAFAQAVPMHAFLLVWAAVALGAAPVALHLRKRFRRIADSDTDLDDESADWRVQLVRVGRAFRTSPYSVALMLTLFVTLLMTNLAEFEYSKVLQKDRDEAQLAALFGQLYAAANIFNLVVCLFVFNRLVTRMGVRNVALILPLTYFAVFAYFFLAGGELAALGAFFAYHGVLTSIEYNNQNLLFNATPSNVKRPLRTMVEGMAEPLASLLAGGFLLFAAKHADMRELSGVGVLLGALLLAVVMAVRFFYPAAMEANMRRGWLNFGDPNMVTPRFDAAATEALAAKTADPDAGAAAAARWLLQAHAGPIRSPGGDAVTEATQTLAAQLSDPSPAVRAAAVQALAGVAGPGDIGLVGPLVAILPDMDRLSRRTILEILAAIGDVEAIPPILGAAARLSPRELRALEGILAGFGEAAIPRLMQALSNEQMAYRARSVGARALSTLSPAQFASQLERLVAEELDQTGRRLAVAQRFEAEAGRSAAMSLLAAAYRERISEAVDFTLELLALGGRLPDFDLLIVSLHSANPKVRGNAVEAVATGVDHPTWKKLEPLINRRTEASGGVDGDLAELVRDAVAKGHGFEACVAAQALRDLVPAADLPTGVRPALERNMPAVYRDSFAILLGLEPADRPTVVDLVAAIRTRPEFAMASLDAQAALAERAKTQAPAAGAIQLPLAAGAWWLSRADVDEVAARYPDLALGMLKSKDTRAYAA